MIFSRFSAVQYAIGGWVMYGAALLVSALRGPSQCPLITRWNVFDSAPATLLFVVALILFAVAGARAWQSESLPRSGVVLGLLVACAFVIVPFNTHDTSFYYSVGKGVATGVNVYDGNWTFTNDYNCPSASQVMTGVMYGPVAVLFMGAVAAIASNPVVFLLIWKLAMVVALGLCVYLSVKLWPGMSKRETLGFFLLQPLILWETVGSGHFDLWWVLLVLLAFVMARAGRWLWVLPILALGTWIKFLPILAVPWFVLWWWSELRRENWLHRLTTFGGGALVALGLTWFAWKPFWTGTHILTPIILQTKWAVSSVFAAIYYTLRPLADMVLGAQAHWWLTRVVQGGLLLLVVYMLWPFVRKAWDVLLRKTQPEPQWYLLGLTLMYVVYVMLWQKSFWPWYITWVLPLVYVVWKMTSAQAFKRVGIYLGAASLGFYMMWIFNHVFRQTDAASEWWFYIAVVSTVWVYPFVVLWRWRRSGYSLE